MNLELREFQVGPAYVITASHKITLKDGRIMQAYDIEEDKRLVEIGSFRYDYFPWSTPLQDLIQKEKTLYGLPRSFPVNDPNFKPAIVKMYADWKREANKSFDPIRGKFPVEFEDE